MGRFEDIKEMAMGRFGESGGESGFLKNVVDMLTSKESGGLSGLVQSFQQKGLGDIISSWIGTGQNLPISPDQVREGVGNQMIQNLSVKTGIPQEELTTKLSENLPNLVDKLTPDGFIPEEGGLLKRGLDFVRRKFH